MEPRVRELKVMHLDSGAPYTQWYNSVKDKRSRVAIDARLQRCAAGNLGDHTFFRGIGELRIDIGPGYRVYFAIQSDVIIVLLGGGDKKTQYKDIDHAVSIWEKYCDEVARLR